MIQYFTSHLLELQYNILFMSSSVVVQGSVCCNSLLEFTYHFKITHQSQLLSCVEISIS